MDTLTIPTSVAAATELALRKLCESEHGFCFACRSKESGGLGISFSVVQDGSVMAEWVCPPEGQSYADTVHGGLLATALDSGMVHALFARGIVARTGELVIRYRKPVSTQVPMQVKAWLGECYPPLFRLEAEIWQSNMLCAKAHAKFMTSKPSE